MYSKDQPCMSCANACGSCSWSHNFIPVENWEAEHSKIQGGIDSYKIKKCPEYIFDGLCLRCEHMPSDFNGDFSKFYLQCKNFTKKRTQGHGDCVKFKNKFKTED